MTGVPGSKFKRGSVEAFGYEIFYAESGEGDTLVSVPGSAGLEMSVAKDMLAENFRVIEFDLPGWGESPAVHAKMRLRQLATILVAALDELTIEKYHLLGTSMGANVALWLASMQPEKVLSMTFEGPMLFHTQDDLRNPVDVIPMIQQGLEYDPTIYPAPPPHPMKPWADERYFHDQMRRRFKMMRYIEHPVDDSPLHGFASATKIPTLLLLGDNDEVLKPDYARTFLDKFSAAALEVAERGTHDLQNTAPEFFVEKFKCIAMSD